MFFYLYLLPFYKKGFIEIYRIKYAKQKIKRLDAVLKEFKRLNRGEEAFKVAHTEECLDNSFKAFERLHRGEIAATFGAFERADVGT